MNPEELQKEFTEYTEDCERYAIHTKNEEILKMTQSERLAEIKKLNQQSKDLYDVEPHSVAFYRSQDKSAKIWHFYYREIQKESSPREITCTNYENAMRRTARDADGWLTGRR